MRFRNVISKREAFAKLYKTGLLAFNVETRHLFTCGRVYIDWIGKKVIFTPTNVDDGYSFKITHRSSNTSVSCRNLKNILPVDEALSVNINKDGTFWIPALEEANE